MVFDAVDVLLATFGATLDDLAPVASSAVRGP
jgi:hypothetical protein